MTGVVIVETLFNYRGFGWLLIEGAENNDIDLLLACSIVAVVIVLATQLISDIGYVYLNPRIRVSLMELAFLTPGAIVAGTLARFLPVWIGMARHHGRRASPSAAGSAPTAGSTTAGIGMIGFGAGALLAADRADGALGRAVRPLRPGPRPAEQGAGRLLAGPRPRPTCSAATRSAATSSAAWSTARRTVMAIAPLATLFAYMVGITLGPARRLSRRLARHRA